MKPTINPLVSIAAVLAVIVISQPSIAPSQDAAEPAIDALVDANVIRPATPAPVAEPARLPQVSRDALQLVEEAWRPAAEPARVRQFAQAAPAVLTGANFKASSTQDGIPPIVVQFSSSNKQVTDSLEEDLAVMTRLLDRALERGLKEEQPATKMGIQMLFNSGARAARAMYLEGFGALFMVKVNFPILAPPAVVNKAIEVPPDTEWDEAKQEIFGQREDVLNVVAPVNTGPEYDEDQVENLKRILVQALKNASNIRQLKPDEFVSVSVFGSPAGTAKVVTLGGGAAGTEAAVVPNADIPAEKAKRKRSSNSAAAKEFQQAAMTYEAFVGNPAVRSSKQGTVLTLRVRKADVDGFAKGKLDFDKFHQTVKFNAYKGSGYSVTSVNSWLRK